MDFTLKLPYLSHLDLQLLLGLFHRLYPLL
jgi:hypothetical protein